MFSKLQIKHLLTVFINLKIQKTILMQNSLSFVTFSFVFQIFMTNDWLTKSYSCVLHVHGFRIKSIPDMSNLAGVAGVNSKVPLYTPTYIHAVVVAL